MAGRIHERGNGNENSSKKVGGAVIRIFGPISQFGDFRSITDKEQSSQSNITNKLPEKFYNKFTAIVSTEFIEENYNLLRAI